MEIRNLITFTKVAESQSLSKAAAQLGYAQSTVTMQMQQLEQELGVPLYERVGKQIRITQAGQELLTYAVPIIKMSQEALRVGRGDSVEIDGSLRVGVLEPLAGEALAERTADYMAAFPGVNLEIVTADGNEELLYKLRHNEIDICMILDYRREEPDLIHAEDWMEPIHWFVSAEHPLAGKKKLKSKDLTEYPLILGDERLPYVEEWNRYLRENSETGAERNHRYIRNQKMALQLATRRTAAIVLAPDSAAEEYTNRGILVPLTYGFPECQVWQQVLYHRNKWLTGAMNAWMNMRGR